jgi:hypothetical protein
VEFVKSRVGNGRGDNCTSIISKHTRGTIKGYSHHMERKTEINDLLSGLTTKHRFRSIGGHIFSLLLFAKDNRCMVDKMNNARNGSTSDKSMVEIGILVGGSTHKLTSRYRLFRRKFLSDITINREAPVILNRGSYTFMVGDFNTKTYSTRQIGSRTCV